MRYCYNAVIYFIERAMSLIEILILAFGLSMDAFAVAVSCGLVLKRPQNAQALKVAVFFGAFQMGMPLLGWLLARGLNQWIAGIGHWAAFGLLFFLGFNMIRHGLRQEPEQINKNPLLLSVLIGLSLATSMDALAAGISFSLLHISVWMPVVTIGCVTFAVSFLGIKIGSKLDRHLESKAIVVGGLILIGLGVKILIKHPMF